MRGERQPRDEARSATAAAMRARPLRAPPRPLGRRGDEDGDALVVARAPVAERPRPRVCVSSASSVKRRCRLRKRTSLTTRAGSRFAQAGRQRSSLGLVVTVNDDVTGTAHEPDNGHTQRITPEVFSVSGVKAWIPRGGYWVADEKLANDNAALQQSHSRRRERRNDQPCPSG